MLTIKLQYAICFIVFMNKINAEVFSAIADVEPLLKAQQKIIYDLEGFIDMQKKRLNVLEKNLQFYKNEHKKAITDIPSYIGNPVNSYSLIKRLTVDLEYIENITKIPIEFDRDETLKYPTREDLQGAIKALARLQDTYLLNTTLLSSGILNGTFSHSNVPFVQKFTPMTASDCYEMGTFLYKAENFKSSIDWMVEALWKFDDNTPEAYYFSAVDIVDHVAGAYKILDDIPNALKWTKLLLTMVPDHLAAKGNAKIEEYEKRIAEDEKANREKKTQGESNKNRTTTKYSKREIYTALCRGEIASPSISSKRLKCRYLTENSPFLKLAPIKMEELYTEPSVYLFHEVLSNEEINTIKETAQPKFQRAKIRQKTKDANASVADTRTCKSAWLEEHGDSIARITRRVSDFTGLNMQTAEKLQVANYGIGGHYEPHYDFFRKDDVDMNGNRIGTVMFYMSDVEQGGATVFIQLGLTVFPVKGAAIFWWNLHPSGETDMDTEHAACPVLLGSKWVSNKWIRHLGQELVKPCNLEYQNAKYDRKIPPPVPKRIK